MNQKTTIVISDVHLGCRHLNTAKFERFLDSLPKGCRLVLNGDTLDATHAPLPPEHQRLMERLLPGNPEWETVWIEGNHDQAEALRRNHSLAVHPYLHLREPRKTVILHGACFDVLGNNLKHGIRLFRALHRARIQLGLSDLHFSEYAQRWRAPYWLMRFLVRFNAMRHARRLGASTVICGHVHQQEDIQKKGIRYINTGGWLGEQNCYLEISNGNMTLRQWGGHKTTDRSKS